MKKEELPQIFADCCAKHTGSRYCINTFFFIDGHAYATDGRWCVRMPCKPFSFTGKAPPADKLFVEWKGDNEPTPLPDPADWPRCENCDDGMVECDCVGGRCTCPDCDAEHDCGKCDGGGAVTCDECCGTGYFPVSEELDGVPFARSYLARLWSYGVREVFLNENKTTAPYGPLRFSLGDIEGLVMPRSKVEP